MNCRGLGDKQKRRDLFHLLKSKASSICCLQDTHFTKEMENFIRSEWGYEAYFSSFNSRSRGVCCLINPTFEHKVNRVKGDVGGNYIILDITIEDIDVTLVNMYGPNYDSPSFYENILEIVHDFNNAFTIYCADWNLIQNPLLDMKNYFRINNPQARQKVLNIIESENLTDPWRYMNPNKHAYTWRQRTPLKQARLDFFLVSKEFMSFIDQATIEHGYRTDHSMITLTCSFRKFERGKGVWRFNNSLLKDPKYVNLVKSVIKRTVNQYSTTLIEDIQDLQIQSPDFEINDQLLFETILMEIRGETVKYASIKKTNMIKEQKEIETKIMSLQDQVSSGNNDKITELENQEQKLKEIREKIIEGVMIRSRARWVENGEKPTKYFCGLEKRNYINKTIDKVQLGNGHTIKEQKLILEEVRNFYSKLYREENLEDKDLESLNLGEHPKLSNLVSEKLEGPLSIEEILSTLKNMKNEKTPGICGYSVEFFKFFWKDLGYLLQRSLNHGYFSGIMSVTQRQGIITCLPKGNKPRQFLKNWRPITLLSVPYKIASGCIANRIKTVLDTLINEDQKGFTKGRYIGENIRLLYDILQITEKEKIPGCLVLIDFEKAFDTISWQFMFKVLKYFNFGNSIITWIKTFYNNISSTVIQSGFLSRSFDVERGCRQGDPLSPYLFILCAEILAEMIRKNENISGIVLNNKENKLSQFADDTSLTLNGSEKSLKETFKTLETFRKISGLKVNLDKTKVVWMGSKKHSQDKLCPNLNLEWCDGQFDSLGVTFSVDLDNMIDLNYAKVKVEITKLINQWQMRNLSVLGKITVVKTLALPKLNYLIMSIPNPPNVFCEDIQKMFFKFIWGNKPDKVKRSQLVQVYALGGAKMIHLQDFVDSLKATWVRRLVKYPSNLQNYFNHIVNTQMPIAEIGPIMLKNIIKEIDNEFWKDVFKSWIKILVTFYKQNNKYSVLANSIWMNDNIKIDGKPVFYKSWFEKGIKFIQDLMIDEQNFISYQEFIEKYAFQPNFIHYLSLINSVKSFVNSQSHSNRTTVAYPAIPPQIQFLLQKDKGCQDFYSLLIKERATKPISENKWETILQMNNGDIAWHIVHQTPFKVCVDVQLRWFQYRLINRFLATNSFLSKINISESPLCDLCQEYQENIEHIFLQCTKTKVFWQQFINLVNEKTNLNINLTDKIIICGNGYRDKMLNFILILAKRFIYSSKLQKKDLLLKNFIEVLKKTYKIEKNYYEQNCDVEKFEKRWVEWKRILI